MSALERVHSGRCRVGKAHERFQDQSNASIVFEAFDYQKQPSSVVGRSITTHKTIRSHRADALAKAFVMIVVSEIGVSRLQAHFELFKRPCAAAILKRHLEDSQRSPTDTTLQATKPSSSQPSWPLGIRG